MAVRRPKPTASTRTTATMTSAGVVTAGALAVIVLIFLSPLALGFIADDGTDWNQLSLIGQSYGAISAILAALAVLGVVLSLRLQQQQIADNRRMMIREQQRELLIMAINDPELLRAWGKISFAYSEDPRLSVYTNLVLNYLIMLHETGTAGLNEIRLHLRMMAADDWMPEYWESTRQVWRTTYPAGSHPVVDLMDEILTASR